MAAIGWYVGRAAAMSPLRDHVAGDKRMDRRTGTLGRTAANRCKDVVRSEAGLPETVLQRFRDAVDRPVLLGEEQANRIDSGRTGRGARADRWCRPAVRG